MIQIGDKKVTKMIVGGNIMVNQEDAWLECEVGPRFSGIPILMHYDKASGTTTLIGRVEFDWALTDGAFTQTLLTLPDGYHFTSIDPNFPIAVAGVTISSNPAIFNVSYQDGRLIGNFERWGWDTSSNAEPVRMAFGFIAPAYLDSNPSVWQTITIAPD